MIYGAGQEYIAQGFLLLMAGIPVYVYIKWRNAKNAATAAAATPSVLPETADSAKTFEKVGG